MQRYQKYIFKAKKLLQKFTGGQESEAPPASPETSPTSAAYATVGRESEAHPAILETTPPPEHLNQEAKIDPDPQLLKTGNRKPKTENPLVYDPWTSPDLGPWLSPSPDNAEPPPDPPRTQNPEPNPNP